MNKYLFTFIVAASIASNLFASDIQIDGIYYIFNDINFTASVTHKGNSYDSFTNEYVGSVIIPDSVTYNNYRYPVTKIGYEAFAGCTALTSVAIPNSITTIRERAFLSCTGLTSITIPNSVTTIGERAFAGCTALTSVTIPYSVTTIGEWAFSYCSSLGSITIPNSITTIEDYAFAECTALTSVTIPNSVTTIGNGAFSACHGLTSITIPNSVTTIGERAFGGCFGLTSVTIPNSVTTIGYDAFYYVNNIVYNGTATWESYNKYWGAKCVNGYIDGYLIFSDATKTTLCGCFTAATGEIIIPNSVTTIGSYAFYECSGLTSVTIPNSVTTIGGWAFSHCLGLTSITIGNSVTRIEDGAFYECSGLTSVTIPNSVTTIGGWAFSHCLGLTSITIGNSVTRIEDGAFYECSGLTSVTIPNSVTSIGESAFCNCSGLTSVEIPNSVTTIGGWAFGGCYNLESIQFDNTIPPTLSSDVFDNVSTSATIFVPCGYALNYKKESALSQFKKYSSFGGDFPYVLTVSSSDNTIGTTEISDAPDCITNEATIKAATVYGYHFDRWNDGNTDNPRTVQVVSDIAFTAEFAKNIYTISAFADNGVVEGTGIYDYGTEATLSVIPDFGYEFATWSDGNTNNPRTILVTEDATYYSTCTLSTKGACGNNLYWEYKEGSLIINGQGAMYNFALDQVPWILYRDSIQQVELCEGLTIVGNNAFASCPNLTSVNIPNSVTTIGESAFEDCTYLKTITLGKSLTNIGCNAFKGDFRIEEITSYAEVTPNVCSSTFDGLSKQYIYLYVPENSIRAYQVDPNWNGFDIRTKAADKKPIDGDNPIITPTDQDVTITWPITDGTDTYTLTITKGGETVCVLTFNANGQLINIAFAAPGHNGAHQAPAATLTAQGYQFTVTGLNPGTAYDYNVTATDAGGQTLAEHKGNFSTTGSESDLQNVRNGEKASKYFHNGNLIIERNGVKYTPAGQKVK